MTSMPIVSGRRNCYSAASWLGLGKLMHCDVRENPDQNFVEAVCSGSVDLTGMQMAIADLRRVDGYVDGMNALWDFQEADLSQFSADDMKALLSYMEETPKRKKVRVAILLSGKVDFMLLKLWRAVSSRRYGQTTELFSDRESAVAWLCEAV
ncbi:hypothetical protein NUH88_18840 [Nisaea acidiphila]|uniref:Uncharacterized protein n=1 Tax=Nisaea acidiphila TaxID=1862145 RepID=A0A9J7AVK3_9PROT|nr:hypothetical protein [Nisaea acidiphila]UUX49445.1 hypothetical protein NUH88_18840 [Nisaea acidiphila]